MTSGGPARRGAVVVRLRRAYEPPSPEDGWRVLVDRLWPRGVRRTAARIDEWARELAPSDRLRRWFGHDPGRWAEFRRRYRAELAAPPDALRALARKAARRRVTLVYGARDEARNNAVVLKALLERPARRGARAATRRCGGGAGRGAVPLPPKMD